MNGDIRPELKIPQAESIDNANFANTGERLPEKKSETFQENQTKVVTIDPLAQIGQSSNPNILEQQITLEKVEKILAQDMDHIFLSLDLAKQAEFKRKGEETSQQITKLLNKGSVPLRKILNLIIDWLRVIPRVNRFYLEQEAKIKTDKIMRLNIKK